MRSPNVACVVFAAVLVLWLLFPIAMRDEVPADGVAFAAAGQLAVDGHGASAYPQTDDRMSPAMLRAECGGCEGGMPFVSPPPSLALVAPLGWLSLRGAELVLRVVGALCLAGGFLLLWRRSDHPAWRETVTTVALASTPIAYVTIQLGQVTPLLVLALAVPFSRLDRRWVAVGVGLLLAGATAFKGFPVVLIVAAYFLGKRLVAGVAAGALVVISVVSLSLAPGSIRAFVDGVRIWDKLLGAPSATASFVSVGKSFAPGPLPVLAQLAAIGLSLALVYRARRVPEAAWVVLAVATMLAWPQSWSHYLLVATVATTVLAARSSASRVLPVLVALATIPAAVAWWWSHEVSNQATAMAFALVAVCLGLTTRRTARVDYSSVGGTAPAFTASTSRSVWARCS